MSIIERVAQLLEPVGQSKPRPSAPVKGSTSPELDLIERAIASELPTPPAAAIQAAERTLRPTPAQPANKARRSARTVAVDLGRLRQQGMIVPGAVRTATAESFRRIKRQVLTNAVNPKASAPANLVLVTSALPGEGKTFCAINLAISIALEVDHSVLLVDADVRKPSIPKVLGFRAEKGLMDLLVDRRTEMAEVLSKTDIGKLTLLPAGTAPEHATELLASGATRELLREMAARYRDRIIIFDSPPLLSGSEASVLASQMGQTVVVVESGKTTEAALKEALGHIDLSRLSGLVLNKGSGPGLGSYYGSYGNGA
jgi:exopolysaccharide/PEP-CTERM locus tyrosine autokinase